MKPVIHGRYTAQMDDSFVVFVIGMRINKLFAVSKWFPVAGAMSGMLKELYKNKEFGFLGTESFFNGRTILQIQYWKSFEALEHYARHASLHVEAWKNFNLKASKTKTVGIFHETYVIEKGQYESVYVNMPRFGLAKAGESIPVNRKHETARARMKP
ncbi:MULTISPECIES: DUF4188 domain-containing protein [unclassified Bacillus (in: firmicutes)]|uniref:DUF4188 domain-containing protein n=1 Tax=unclassified Bacillus (in: firmicutes) TaxID=185979 RepID=UPI000B8092E7|nr:MULTISPECIES: DUF4188 domain-containing protein [unclassified Bacillus (in: firmicutes)]